MGAGFFDFPGHHVDVLVVDFIACFFVDCFGGASCVVGDDGCAAGEGFEVGGGEVVFECGVDKDVGHVVEGYELVDAFGSTYSCDSVGEGGYLVLGKAYEYDGVLWREEFSQFYEFVEAFSLVPYACDSEDYFFVGVDCVLLYGAEG